MNKEWLRCESEMEEVSQVDFPAFIVQKKMASIKGTFAKTSEISEQTFEK